MELQATTAGRESVSECKAPAVDIIQWSSGAVESTVGAKEPPVMNNECQVPAREREREVRERE